ncbi:glycosyl transferase [Bacteroidia bacterium]|nr:glycosyl transferase [Bacteroidia bacterium]
MITVFSNSQDAPSLCPPVRAVYTLKDLCSTESAAAISRQCKTDYILMCDALGKKIEITQESLQRMLNIAEATGADWVYSDYFAEKDGKTEAFPLIDYQQGSLRDDFRFGALVLIRAESFREAAAATGGEYRYAAIYRLRLAIAQRNRVFHIREMLYTCRETQTASFEKAMFAYVDPANRDVQQEMERACSDYLKTARAWIAPETLKTVDVSQHHFPCEATVVIPVRNRLKTIGDAIDSALSQSATFAFNVIVVDNHSEDGTTQVIAAKTHRHPNLIHLIPDCQTLGIGGCWNAAVNHPDCGRFAVQLDSDDLYADADTLSRIVNCFYETRAAMVIGAYRMVDYDLNELPPGVIDHREWTRENGHNNALRVNGFGAPRAFYTPVLRETGFPNVSYGEDYAVALAISRRYTVGRIYEPVYLCRRWSENSDAGLTISKQNEYNLYKDGVRTVELYERVNE